MEPCWKIEARDPQSGARAGRLVARDASELPTPLFQPVATAGSVKTLDWHDVSALGYRHVLMNTYHLVVRPGIEAIRRAGGVKAFTGWNGSVLTDSGGYQVHSLSSRRSLREDGVRFTDHIEGSHWHFSPRFTLEAQLAFGVDFAMMLDVCTSLPASRNRTRRDLELTHAWAREQADMWPQLLEEGIRDEGLGISKDKSGATSSSTSSLVPNPYSLIPRLFGIVQGGLYEELRAESAELIGSLPFDGVAIGGLSVGESREDFQRLTAYTSPLLPESKVRYLMGVGEPGDMLFAIAQGIDMFDCVQPTRLARHGTAYTSRGKLNLKLARFAGDERPLDSDCACRVCQSHSRAYLRHLVTLSEHSYARLLTIHNLHFYRWLLCTAREQILAGNYAGWWPDQASAMDAPLPEER